MELKEGEKVADERSNNEGVDLFIVIGSPWTWLLAQTHRRYNCMRVYGVSVDYFYYFFFSKFWPQLGHDRDMIVTQ